MELVSVQHPESNSRNSLQVCNKVSDITQSWRDALPSHLYTFKVCSSLPDLETHKKSDFFFYVLHQS
jgi:hypothetical protein